MTGDTLGRGKQGLGFLPPLSSAGSQSAPHPVAGRALPRTVPAQEQGAHLSVGVLVGGIVPGVVVVRHEREVLLLLPLQSGRSAVHVGGKVALGRRHAHRVRKTRGQSERDSHGTGDRQRGGGGTAPDRRGGRRWRCEVPDRGGVGLSRSARTPRPPPQDPGGAPPCVGPRPRAGQNAEEFTACTQPQVSSGRFTDSALHPRARSSSR